MSPVSNKTTDAAATGFRHPLTEFKGLLVDINEKSETSRNNKKYVNIQFDFADIEVIEANEPYNFPTTQLLIAEFNIPGSNWEEYKKSLRTVGYSGDLNGLIDKRHHMKWAPAILSNRNQETGKYEMVDSYCWQVVGIEGVENTTGALTDLVITLANGHTADEFKASFLANNEARTLSNYAEVLTAAMSNTLLPSLVAAGALKQDGNKYAKV